MKHNHYYYFPKSPTIGAILSNIAKIISPQMKEPCFHLFLKVNKNLNLLVEKIQGI